MPRARRVVPQPLLHSTWWSQLSFTAKLATSVGAIAGAVVTTGAAWAFLELPIVSTRTWTLVQVEQLRRQIEQHGTVLYDIRRSQLERNIIELEQKKVKRTSDEEFRLRAMKEDMRRLDVEQVKK